MNSDHRDPLHDSRNAMTEWERSLRPTRERHWAMWIALSALLLFALYRGAEWLLAQRRRASAGHSMHTSSGSTRWRGSHKAQPCRTGCAMKDSRPETGGSDWAAADRQWVGDWWFGLRKLLVLGEASRCCRSNAALTAPIRSRPHNSKGRQHPRALVISHEIFSDAGNSA